MTSFSLCVSPFFYSSSLMDYFLKALEVHMFFPPPDFCIVLALPEVQLLFQVCRFGAVLPKQSVQSLAASLCKGPLFFFFPNINLINFILLIYMKTTHISYGQRQRLLLVANNRDFPFPHFLEFCLIWSWSGSKLVIERNECTCVQHW